MSDSASLEGDWIVDAASVRGSDHIRRSLPNQDAFAWRRSSDTKSVAAVVCDGAGSSPQSHVGAQGMASPLAESLITLYESGVFDPNIPDTKQRVIDLIATVRSQLIAQVGEALDDYNCTLTAALVGPQGALFAQIGDSICVRGELNYSPSPHEADFPALRDASVIAPHRGKFAGETRFVTERTWRDYLIVELTSEVPDFVALMSDGAAEQALEEERPASAFLSVIIGWMGTAGSHEPDEIEQVLASERMTKEVSDDRTLVVLLRRQAVPQSELVNPLTNSRRLAARSSVRSGQSQPIPSPHDQSVTPQQTQPTSPPRVKPEESVVLLTPKVPPRSRLVVLCTLLVLTAFLLPFQQLLISRWNSEGSSFAPRLQPPTTRAHDPLPALAVRPEAKDRVPLPPPPSVEDKQPSEQVRSAEEDDVTLQLRGLPQTATVTVDDASVTDIASLHLNPGNHTLSIRAAGYQAFNSTLTLQSGMQIYRLTLCPTHRDAPLMVELKNIDSDSTSCIDKKTVCREMVYHSRFDLASKMCQALNPVARVEPGSLHAHVVCQQASDRTATCQLRVTSATCTSHPSKHASASCRAQMREERPAESNTDGTEPRGEEQ